MTTRLYYDDTYLAAFDATVVERADGGRRLYLDRSAFYPTSGGQPHDLGTLGGIAVVDVIDEDERVAHLLAEPYTGGDTIHGKIDWARRWDYTQQHTGQHLLSATCYEVFGWQTVSVHFGDTMCTLELDAPAISPKQLRQLEERANAFVTENRAVAVTYEDAEVAAARLRKKPDRVGTLRIVTIADLDVSACGGTHVRQSGEIGAVQLRRVEKVRNNVRVEFVCGQRAVRRARADQDALTAIASQLSAAVDEVAPLVQAQAEEVRALASASKKLIEELGRFRARALWDATPAGPDGVRRLRLPDGLSADEMRAQAAACAALPRTVAVGTVRASRSISLATSEDTGLAAGAALKDVLTAHGGRGGGAPRTAQGTVGDDAALTAVVEALLALPVAN